MRKPMRYFSANQRHCLRNLLHQPLVEPDQSTMFFLIIYLFVSRHEVHSMNTHTLQKTGWYKQTKQNVVQGTEAGDITVLQTLYATALKTEP